MKTLIRGGFVVDPANCIMKITNVLLDGDKIAEVTDALPQADFVYDAAGMTVTPGFIDIHMHGDPYDPKTKTFSEDIAPCMLRMGVTTMVGGNCGSNRYDPSVYLDEADRLGVAANIALFAGHSTIRSAVTSRGKYEHSSDDEIAKMRIVAERWLEAGCVGVSYGVRYVPGSTPEELMSTAAACAKHGRCASAHIRDDAAFVFDAAREFLDISKKAGIPAEISHIGSMAGFGQMKEFLSMLHGERKQGFPVFADCYPYYAFSTEIGETTYDDGFLERYGIGYDVIEICEGKYKGMRCTKKIFDDLRKNDPDVLTVCYVMHPEDVDLAILDSEVAVGSDGILSNGQGHPRAAGAFPKYLHDYVLSGKIGLSDGIAKITSLPAKRLGLTDRGNLSRGSAADLVIFDPKSIRDNATFASPTLPPDGIRAVFVRGVLACESNRILTLHAGRSVRVLST